MSDIVERLRRKVSHGPTMEAVHTKAVEWQAADEIERLRNELHIAEQWSARVYAGRDQDVAEITRLRAALDILQAAMTANKPIPLAFKRAIIDARAKLSGDKHE